MPEVARFRIPLTRPFIARSEVAAVTEVLESRWLTQGRFVQQLEADFTALARVPHAVACSNATVGLEMVLRAAGIRKGSRVVVPDFTHPATANAARILGASVVLIDVNPDSYTLDWAKAARAAALKPVDAAIPVSLFGHPVCVQGRDALLEGCPFLVEDAACAVGSSLYGAPPGAGMDAAVFSLHPRKTVTCGEGGVITTPVEEVAQFCRDWRNFGPMGHDGMFRGMGSNCKMSDVQAAIATVQMQRLPVLLSRRRRLAERYSNRLHGRDDIVTPRVQAGATHSWQTYVVRIHRRDRVMQSMRDLGIECQIGSYALHMHPGFALDKTVSAPFNLPASTRLSQSLLALPLYPEMLKTEQDDVVATLTMIVEEVEEKLE